MYDKSLVTAERLAELKVGRDEMRRAGFAEALRLQVAGRIEHFLHARTAARTFMRDDHDVARTDFTAENAVAGIVLRFIHAGRPFEFKNLFIIYIFTRIKF